MPALLALPALLLGAPAPGEAVDYLRDIKPVLQARCYACHGALQQKAGLRVDTAAALRLGSAEGPVLVPGAPDQGLLLARLTSTDEHERMPLEAAPLEAGEIAAIRAWIAQGAPMPENERGEDDPREHWAFQRIERPDGAAATRRSSTNCWPLRSTASAGRGTGWTSGATRSSKGTQF